MVAPVMNGSSFDHLSLLPEPLKASDARRTTFSTLCVCALLLVPSLAVGCIDRQQGKASAEPAKSVDRQSQSPGALPVMELVHNFGIVPVNAAQTHQFRIKNPAKSIWHLADVRSECSCTVAKPSSLTIEPGGEITVPVTLKGRSRSEDIERKVVLRLAEREAPQIILRIKATVREALALYPKTLHFDVYSVQADERLSTTIDNFAASPWSGLQFSNVPEWLDIRQEQVSQPLDAGEERSSPRQRWKLVVSPKRTALPRLPFGIHEAEITVNAISSNACCFSTMFVRLHRHRQLEAIPSDLFFGELAPGECKSMSALILDRRPADAQEKAPLTGPSVQTPLDPRLQCKLESRVGSAWRIRVIFRAGQLEGYANTDLKMSFGAIDDLKVILPCRVHIASRPQG